MFLCVNNKLLLIISQIHALIIVVHFVLVSWTLDSGLCLLDSHKSCPMYRRHSCDKNGLSIKPQKRLEPTAFSHHWYQIQSRHGNNDVFPRMLRMMGSWSTPICCFFVINFNPPSSSPGWSYGVQNAQSCALVGAPCHGGHHGVEQGQIMKYIFCGGHFIWGEITIKLFCARDRAPIKTISLLTMIFPSWWQFLQ